MGRVVCHGINVSDISDAGGSYVGDNGNGNGGGGHSGAVVSMVVLLIVVW